MPLQELFNFSNIEDINSFQQKLNFFLFEEYAKYSTYDSYVFATLEKINQLQKNLSEISQIPNFSAALINLLDEKIFLKFFNTAKQHYRNIMSRDSWHISSKIERFNTRILMKISALKIDVEKIFFVNFAPYMLIFFEYVNFIVERSLLSDNPLSSRNPSANITGGYDRNFFPLFGKIPRDFFHISERTLEIYPIGCSSQQFDHVKHILSDDKLTTSLLIFKKKHSPNIAACVEFFIKPVSFQELVIRKDDMLTALRNAGKITHEKEALLDYMCFRCVEPDSSFFSIGSRNVSKFDKLSSAYDIYTSFSSSRPIKSINWHLMKNCAIQRGRLGNITKQITNNLNNITHQEVVSHKGFGWETANIEGLLRYKRISSKENLDFILSKIQENEAVIKNLISSFSNFYRLVTMSEEHAKSFFKIVFSSPILTDNVISSLRSLEEILVLLRTIFLDERNEIIIINKVFYSKKLPNNLRELVANPSDIDRCVRAFPCYPLYLRPFKENFFMATAARRNVIEKSQLLHHASYSNLPGGLFKKLSRAVPDNILADIAAYTADPKYLTMDEAQSLARESFHRPGRSPR
jgi:hypothetical protein